MSGRPRLSVVVVTRGPLANLRLTIAALGAQTIAGSMELLVVAPSAAVLGEARPSQLAPFGAVEAVGVGLIEDVDRASAAGLLRAAAPVVASVEDHAFPAPDWAEEVLRAHEGPWSVVGGRMTNCNPGRVSWANMLITDSPGVTGAGGETWAPFSSHNAVYRTAVLREYGERLPGMMGRDGGLMRDLLARGHRLYVTPAARYGHLQVTRWSAQVALHVQSGRNAAAGRAAAAGWGPLRRLARTAALPLVPGVLVARRMRAARALGLSYDVLPALALAASLFAFGEALGHLRGAGRSRERLAGFETGRRPHLSRRDRARYDRTLARLDEIPVERPRGTRPSTGATTDAPVEDRSAPAGAGSGERRWRG